MRQVRTLLFAVKARLTLGARVATGAYLKGHKNILIGKGCKIHEGASVDASRGSVQLGDGVILNRFAYLQGGRGGVRLSKNVEINNFSIINGTGGVHIGEGTLIGPGVRIISYQHRFEGRIPVRDQPSDGKPIVIGRDVWIGANAIILAGVTVGEGAVIGAGAVVNADVPDWAVAVGVPARVVKTREGSGNGR